MEGLEGRSVIEALHEKMREVGQAAMRYAENLEDINRGGSGNGWSRGKLIQTLDQLNPKDLTRRQTQSAEYFRDLNPARGIDTDEIRDNAKPFLNPENE